ncbi:MAG: hypothetical protein RSD75_02440, partial [Mucinivorans sp.]
KNLIFRSHLLEMSKLLFRQFYCGSINPHVLRVRSGSSTTVRPEKSNFQKPPLQITARVSHHREALVCFVLVAYGACFSTTVRLEKSNFQKHPSLKISENGIILFSLAVFL